MRCCVSWCINNKSKQSSDNVSYRRFPPEHVERQTWISTLGLNERRLTNDSVVCSNHFIDNFLCSRKSGPSPVQEDAKPFVQVCVVCLDTERRVHPLSKYKLEQAYETITGLELQDLTDFTPFICFECAQRLTQCKQFRDKSARGHALLVELIRKHDLLTAQRIKEINRSVNFLTSNLVEKVFQPNYCDVNFIDIKKETIQIKCEDRVNESIIKVEKEDHILVSDDKTQYENYIDIEKRDIKDDDDDDNANIDYLDDIIDEVFTNDDDDDDDDELFNDNNYTETGAISDGEQFIDKNENDSDIELVDKKDDKLKTSDIKKLNQYRKGNLIDKNEKDSDIELVDKKDDKLKTSDIKKLNQSRKGNLASYKNCNNKISKTQTNKKNLTKKVSVAKPKTSKVKSKDKLDKDNTKNLNATKRGTLLTTFKITKLSLEKQFEDLKTRQESSNYKNSSFQCNFCYRGFQCNSTFTRHMDKHSKANGDVECPVCKMRYKTREAFLAHNLSHSTRYNCTLCDFFSMNSTTARMHERWHMGLKHICPHCQEEFSKITSYITHLRLKHPSDFICCHCGFSFISQKGLKFHILRTHRKDKLEEPAGPHCEQCKVRFSSQAAFEQHLKVSPKHSQPGIRKRNDRRTNFKDVVPPYITCELCGTKLKDFSTYAQHFKSEHPGDVRTQHAPRTGETLCEQCGQSFQNGFLLRQHMTKHTGQKDYQCDVCQKRFRTKLFLFRHMDTHAPSPQYSCPICGKLFSSPSSRNRHEKIHTEKAFKCNICGKAFSQADTRSSHVAHVHMNVPWPKRNRGRAMRRTNDE